MTPSSAMRLFSCIFALMLLFSAAHAEIVPLPIDLSGGMPLTEKYEQGKMEYDDPSIHVTREWVQSEEFYCTYYVAYITIADPSQLRTAPAGSFNSSQRVEASVIAKRVNAVVAINGDYYSNRDNVYVLRQGVLYHDSVTTHQDLLLIDEDGNFHVILAAEDPIHADKTTVNGKKVINAFDFGPALIRDGEVCYVKESCQRNTKPHERAQRIAICQLGDLSYMVVCCARYGLDMENFIKLIQSLGDVKVAYNLDGGNSCQLIFLGKKVNNTGAQNVRAVPDIIYFASAYQPD